MELGGARLRIRVCGDGVVHSLDCCSHHEGPACLGRPNMRKYARFLIPIVVIVGVLGFLMVNLSSSLVYFSTPAELQAREPDDARLRLGGQVVPGSVVENDKTVTFLVQDCGTSVTVVHTGVPPQLFQDGIGIVLEGFWTGEQFNSDTMLVKHDEQYRSDVEDYNESDKTCSQP